jgi:ParB family chromosome partitioning protein
MRSLDEDKVAELMESMSTELGLINAIVVETKEDLWPNGLATNEKGEYLNQRLVLVAGAHRLEAAKRLGWTAIKAKSVDYYDDFAGRLIEIAENLHRADLTVLDRSKHLMNWLELVEARRKAAAEDQAWNDAQDAEQGDQKDDAPPEEVSAQLAPKCGRPESGINAAAREFGYERTDVQRAVKVASITPEAEVAAREAGLDDNQSALLKVAAEEPEAQVAKVEEIAGAKKKPRKAKAAAAADHDEIPARDYYDAFLIRADAAARYAFYSKGKIDSDIIASASLATAMWSKLLRALESGRHVQKDEADGEAAPAAASSPATSDAERIRQLEITNIGLTDEVKYLKGRIAELEAKPKPTLESVRTAASALKEEEREQLVVHIVDLRPMVDGKRSPPLPPGPSGLDLKALAETIKGHSDKVEQYLKKAEEHCTSGGIHLQEAEIRVKKTPGLMWTAFLFGWCQLTTARAHELKDDSPRLALTCRLFDSLKPSEQRTFSNVRRRDLGLPARRAA